MGQFIKKKTSSGIYLQPSTIQTGTLSYKGQLDPEILNLASLAPYSWKIVCLFF